MQLRFLMNAFVSGCRSGNSSALSGSRTFVPPISPLAHTVVPFAFGGLWERWKPAEDAEPIDTFTLLTTTPNELVRPIHDRMPVIVDPTDFARWLDRDK